MKSDTFFHGIFFKYGLGLGLFSDAGVFGTSEGASN